MTAKATRSPRLSDYLSAILNPLLPPLLGCAAVRAAAILCNISGILSEGDPTYTVLLAVGDGFFYFSPILLAYSIAKQQGSSQPLAILVAAILLHPDLTALLIGSDVSFLGIPVRSDGFSATVLPLFLLTLLLKFIERLADRITPTILQGWLKPLIVLLGAASIALWGIGPLVRLAGVGLADGFHYLYGVARLPAVLLLSLLMPLLILLGLHHAVIDPADIGPWSVAFLSATFALAGIALATLRSRDRKVQQVALGASLTAWLGIPEPAAYATALLWRPLLAASIASAVGGLIGELMHLARVTEGQLSPVFALIAAAGGDGIGDLLRLIAALLLPLLVGFGLGLWVLRPYSSEENWRVRQKKRAETPIGGEPSVTVCNGGVSVLLSGSAGAVPISIASPMEGEVLPLSRVNDPAFASGVMGQGCAILPTFGKVYAPCDGVIASVSAGKNVLTIDSKQGVQMLIHVGVDAAALAPDRFDLCCRSGDAVKTGDLLLSFSMDGLSQTDLTTPLLVVNMDRFEDLSLTCQPKVKAGDRILTLVPKR
jgi:PTS system beta-glucosides-specific IIC component